MRLIDADAIPTLAVSIKAAEENRTILRDHAKGKLEIIRRTIDAFIKTIDIMPEIDQWHYPSKGDYPLKNKFRGEKQKVICLFRDGSCVLGWYFKTKINEGWLTNCGVEPIGAVKAWMPLPEQPKEEQK